MPTAIVMIIIVIIIIVIIIIGLFFLNHIRSFAINKKYINKKIRILEKQNRYKMENAEAKSKKLVYYVIVMVLLAGFSIAVLYYSDVFPSHEYIHEEEEKEEEEKELVEPIPKEEYSENPDEYSYCHFNQCLADRGLVIFCRETCSGCENLLEDLGGYDSAKPVYIDCNKEENEKRCDEEANEGYIPEVHFQDEIYQGVKSPEGFSETTGCPLP